MDPKEKKNLCVFSYGLAIIFAVFVLLHVRKNGWTIISCAFLMAASAGVLITIVFPTWLKPLYQRWMRVAYFISSIVTVVGLSLLFYGIFAPIGILLRLFKKDFLDRSFDKMASSYWSKREPPVADMKRYTQQF